MFSLISGSASSSESQDITLDVGVAIEPDPQFFPFFPEFDVYIEEFEKPYERGTVEYEMRKQTYEERK